jgi:hypothetical protein
MKARDLLEAESAKSFIAKTQLPKWHGHGRYFFIPPDILRRTLNRMVDTHFEEMCRIIYPVSLSGSAQYGTPEVVKELMRKQLHLYPHIRTKTAQKLIGGVMILQPGGHAFFPNANYTGTFGPIPK